MRVLGIDPGTRIVGYGVVAPFGQPGRSWRLVASTAVSTDQERVVWIGAEVVARHVNLGEEAAQALHDLGLGDLAVGRLDHPAEHDA